MVPWSQALAKTAGSSSLGDTMKCHRTCGAHLSIHVKSETESGIDSLACRKDSRERACKAGRATLGGCRSELRNQGDLSSILVYQTTHSAASTPHGQKWRGFELAAKDNRQNVRDFSLSGSIPHLDVQERILTCRARPRHQDKKREPLRRNRDRLVSGMAPHALPILPRFLSVPAAVNMFTDMRDATKVMTVGGANRHTPDVWNATAYESSDATTAGHSKQNEEAHARHIWNEEAHAPGQDIGDCTSLHGDVLQIQ